MNFLTSVLAKILVKVKWASLVNILMNKTIFPELLGQKANPKAVFDCLQELTLPSIRKKMIQELKNADKKWTKNSKNSAQMIADDILK